MNTKINKKNRIELEDDSLREGAQSLHGRTLSAKDRFTFVQNLDRLGVDHFICGFPEISSTEFECIRVLLKKMIENNSNAIPWVLTRLRLDSTNQFLKLKKTTEHKKLGVSYFISVDNERLKLENWSLEEIVVRLKQVFEKLQPFQVQYVSLNLEGISRVKPLELENILNSLSGFEFYSLFLCDSLGICLPSDVTKLVSTFKQNRPPSEKLGWHGHNDFGLATANSLAAWQSGADIISGTFTGVGERAGNLPLEQLILILNERFGYKFDLLTAIECCTFLMNKFDYNVSKYSPLIGEYCYQTQVGTHGAALIKARKQSNKNEAVYTPFNYEQVQKKVKFKLGPQSGRRMCKEKIIDLGFTYEPCLVESLFSWIKKQDRVMQDSEILLWINQRTKHG